MRTQEVDLLAQDVVQDPYPTYAAWRAQGPVHWNANWRGWMVCDYVSSKRALFDPEFFSVRRLPVGRDADPAVQRLMTAMGSWLSFREDDAHKDLRRWLGGYVRNPKKGAVNTVVQTCAQELAAEVVNSRGVIDFASAFSERLSNAVICQILGAPREDWEMLSRWAQDLKPVVHSDPLDEQRFVRAAQAFDEILSYTTERIDIAPRDQESMFAALAQRDDLDSFERAALVTEWIFGGNETTASALSSAVTCLANGPIRDEDLLEDDLLDQVCEEVLRYEPPLKATARVVVKQTTLGGVEMAVGDRVLVLIGAANRDPVTFANPEAFDPYRANNRANLTFGFGAHFCLGAHLARLELKHAIRELAAVGLFGRATVHDVHWTRSVVSRSTDRLGVIVN
jgi:cytochrome P450